MGSVGIGYAQPNFTVYSTLTSNSTTANPRLLGPVQNIGQSFHQFALTIAAQSGKTCKFSTAADSIILQGYGSYVPINISQILTNAWPIPARFYSPPAFSSTNLFTMMIQAVGAFPYVYLHVKGIDTSNCQYTVNYTGTLYPISPLAPLPSTYNFVSITTATTTNLIAASSTVNAYNNVYSLFISNATAGQTIILQCSNGPIGGPPITFNNMQAGQIFSQETINANSPSAEAIIGCTTNSNLQVVTSAATPVYVKITYKVE